jgi:hypothetical protein
LKLSLEEYKEQLELLFHPEPDEDGIPLREYPNRRLRDTLRLNFDYMSRFDSEGSSGHKYTRLAPENESHVRLLTRSQDMPERLLASALRLMSDSISAYHDLKERHGEIRYYPPIIFTAWAGFETFVRHMSELLIVTSHELPVDIVRFLREEEVSVTPKGEIRVRSKFNRVLDRYSIFLKYAYGYEVDRGAGFWQTLEKSKELRDYYTHLDISEPRALKASEVLAFLEAIFLGLIVPSSHLQRTMMMGQYALYEIWTFLHDNCTEFAEKPFFLDWHLGERYLFHCNFENVDKARFPSMREDLGNSSGPLGARKGPPPSS